MSPRTGRPPSENPKHNQYRIRLSDDELKMIEFCQSKTGKSKAGIIREGINKVYQELSQK